MIEPGQCVAHYLYGRGRVIAIDQRRAIAAVSFADDRPVARSVLLADLAPAPAAAPRLELVSS